MTIDELVSRLLDIRRKHGNVKVKCFPYDGQLNPSEVESVGVADSIVTSWDATRNDWVRAPCEKYVSIDA